MNHVTTLGEIRILDLNTGAVDRDQLLPTATNSLAVSHDGTYAALATSSVIRIVDLTDGQVVSEVAAVSPSSFSWDDARLAVDGTDNRGEVVDVETGKVLWIDSVPGRVAQGAIGEPNGRDVMFYMTTGGLDDLLVVSGTGAERVIATGVFPAVAVVCVTCSAF